MKRSTLLSGAGAIALTLVTLVGCSSTKPADNTSAAAGGETTSAVESSAAESSAAESSAGSETAASSASSEASAGGSAAEPSKASKDYKLSFIQGVTGDNFYITMQCGIEAQAKKLGVTVNTQGPAKFDPTLQKPILDSVVQSKPDAILIAPTSVDAMQAPLAAAAAAGIKIVLVDTTTSDPSYAVSQIASDNIGGGKAAFDAVKQLAPDGGKVLVVSVDPGISTTDDRAKGFNDAAKADGNYTPLPIQYSHNDPSTAAQIVTAALQKDPDIVGIFATNLFAAEGSATGIQQAGKQGKVKIVGFDAGPDQIDALKAGTVQALVAQQPGKIGTEGVNQAVAALDGGTVTPKIQTGFSIITKDNVDTTKDAYVAGC
ncbi:ABC transporter substrate-binding protein [Nakamurella lactea]|uniref:ABC transporter substrate-binding protein n=1 Tax=Nakamurella lactea TaxID=459515 RepID=UPI00041E66F3|nr:ABC transporter substrate-binding protein [Nakamurella lactea]